MMFTSGYSLSLSSSNTGKTWYAIITDMNTLSSCCNGKAETYATNACDGACDGIYCGPSGCTSSAVADCLSKCKSSKGSEFYNACMSDPSSSHGC